MRPAAVAAGLALAVSIGGCARGPAPGPALRPGTLAGANVLLVTIDTLRRDRVGAYGTHGGLTPTIDRLAAGGVRFSRAYSHVPMTLPAHASILTGRLPPGHGVRTNGAYRLPDDAPTLATVLQGAGYRNGAFVGAFVLDARYGLARAFDVYDDHYGDARSTFAVAERRAADVVEAAGDWILAPTSSGKWFAWVHLFDPHAPYDAPAEYRSGRAPYDAEVAYTDAMLGRLLDRLGGAGALDHTLIVVTADHGESLGEHGETTHGLFAYDATLAVPLVFGGAMPRLIALARDVDQGPMVQANALGYLRRYRDPAAEGALVAALSADHPLLRMVAASSLQGSSQRAALWSALDDAKRAVRLSALVSIVNSGDRPSSPGDRARFRRVSVEFAEQARMHEDDAVTQTDLGLVHLLNGDLARASDALTISRSLEPAQARPMFLLGLVRLGEARVDEARALFEQVPASDSLYLAARRQLQSIKRK